MGVSRAFVFKESERTMRRMTSALSNRNMHFASGRSAVEDQLLRTRFTVEKAGFVVLFRRDICSSAPMRQLQEQPEDYENGVKKKPILGLQFLSKLFGRGEAGVSAVEAGVSAVEAGAASEVQEAENVTEVQECDNLNEAQAIAIEAEAATEVQEYENSIEAAESVTIEAGESENITETASEVQVYDTEAENATRAYASDQLNQQTVESSAADKTASESSSGEFKFSAPSSDAVREFVETLPIIPVEAASKSNISEPMTHPTPKTSASTKTKPAAAIPTQTSTTTTDAGPIFDFLRTKLRDASKPSIPTPATQTKAIPSLKLSPRFDALKNNNGSTSPSSSSAAAAATATESNTEKSATGTSATPILDSLQSKQSDLIDILSQPTRLSVSTPHVEAMDAQTLMTEMNNCLTEGKVPEAVKMFEDWRSGINPVTLDSNKPDRILYNLYMQAKLKMQASYEELLEVVTEMEEAEMPRDLAGNNILIRALFRKKDSAQAEQILERMEKGESNARPDADSYNLVVVLCALDRKVNAALKHLKNMLDKGFEPSRTTMNEILLASARCYETQIGASLLKDIKASDKLPQPMLNTCAELLQAASEVDDAECARLALFAIAERPMAKFGPKLILDEGTMTNVIGTSARTGDGILCNKAWEVVSNHTRNLGRIPCADVYLARIHALSCIGDLSVAFKAVYDLEKCYGGGGKSDVDSEVFSPFSSLKCLATACSKGGASALDAAYYKLEEAHNNKKGVAVAALNCIILGCSNLWDSERAFQTFEAIENVFGLRPDIHSCNALIHALGRTKMTEDALKVYDYVKEAGFQPDKWTYTLLADAHLVNQDSKAALDVMKNMISIGHLPLRQTTSKIWTRCKQHNDNEGLERLRKIEQELNYRPSHFATTRRKILLDFVKS